MATMMLFPGANDGAMSASSTEARRQSGIHEIGITTARLALVMNNDSDVVGMRRPYSLAVTMAPLWLMPNPPRAIVIARNPLRRRGAHIACCVGCRGRAPRAPANARRLF